MMASQSEDGSSPRHGIIEFVPRHLLRRDAHHLVALVEAGSDMGVVRRRLAEACARYGTALVRELGRVLARGSLAQARAAVALLLVIADEPAQTLLWQVGRDAQQPPALRLDALRGLCQSGHDVPLAELVELANAAERGPRPRERDAP